MLVFVTCAWAVHFAPVSDTVKFIPGQQEIHDMLSCASIQQFIIVDHALAGTGHANDADTSTSHAAKVIGEDVHDVHNAVTKDPSNENLIETFQALIDLYDIYNTVACAITTFYKEVAERNELDGSRLYIQPARSCNTRLE